MKIMDNLKEKYEQALECINDMLKHNKYEKEETIRLKTKASCYRTFLNDLTQVLNIDIVSGWLLFEDNTHLFGEAYDMNYWCKFEDGTECRYRDEHPFAKMTHFKID